MCGEIIIVLNQHHLYIAGQVFFNEGHVVGKNKKNRINHSFPDLGDGMGIILRRQNDPAFPGMNGVSTADVKRHWVPASADLLQ